jgi:hypothetical protein
MTLSTSVPPYTLASGESVALTELEGSGESIAFTVYMGRYSTSLLVPMQISNSYSRG